MGAHRALRSPRSVDAIEWAVVRRVGMDTKILVGEDLHPVKETTITRQVEDITDSDGMVIVHMIGNGTPVKKGDELSHRIDCRQDSRRSSCVDHPLSDQEREGSLRGRHSVCEWEFRPPFHDRVMQIPGSSCLMTIKLRCRRSGSPGPPRRDRVCSRVVFPPGVGTPRSEVLMPSATRNRPAHRGGPVPEAASVPGWLRLASPLITISLVVVAGCGETNRYVEPPPPEVTVAAPVRRAVTDYLEATGTTQPVLSVDIRARVRGFLKERHFKEGSVVKKGQLLLVIDEEPFRLALDQAKARLAEAEASLQKAKQSRAREVARAQLALDESQLQLARLGEARQRNLIGPERRHPRGAGPGRGRPARRPRPRSRPTGPSLEQAEADYETNILAAEAGVGAARTAVRNAEIELGYCRMYRPDRRPDQPGQLPRRQPRRRRPGVAAGDDRQDRPDLCLHERQRGRPAPVPDADRRRQPGRPPASPPMPMELGLADERGYPHRGRADYQDPGVDPGTGHGPGPRHLPQSRRRDPAGLVRPGPRARSAGGRTRCSSPSGRWGRTSPGQYLLVVGKDDVVEYRPVKAGTQARRDCGWSRGRSAPTTASSSRASCGPARG